jgi:hypothetical protein
VEYNESFPLCVDQETGHALPPVPLIDHHLEHWWSSVLSRLLFLKLERAHLLELQWIDPNGPILYEELKTDANNWLNPVTDDHPEAGLTARDWIPICDAIIAGCLHYADDILFLRETGEHGPCHAESPREGADSVPESCTPWTLGDRFVARSSSRGRDNHSTTHSDAIHWSIYKIQLSSYRFSAFASLEGAGSLSDKLSFD